MTFIEVKDLGTGKILYKNLANLAQYRKMDDGILMDFSDDKYSYFHDTNIDEFNQKLLRFEHIVLWMKELEE